MLQHFDSTFAKLNGRILTEVERESDSSIILRFANHKSATLSVTGDCCSSSIFYAIESCRLPSEIIGAEQYVSDEETHEEDVGIAICKENFPEFLEYTECLRIWDVLIQTKFGVVRVRHINDSNGYYDGMVELTGEDLFS